MSRDNVLNATRRGLHRGPLPIEQRLSLHARMGAGPRHLIPARSRLGRRDQVALFMRNVEKQCGTLARVPGLADVVRAVAEYLASHNLPTELVVAPHPELRNIPWTERPLLRLREGRPGANDLVSLQPGFAGVAETGTLVLPGAPERPALPNQLPDTTLVVLRVSRVVGAYEEAWDLLRNDRDEAATGIAPQNVMLITGPSRSGDDPSPLEPGGHGPRRLHVVLVDDDPAAAGPRPGADPS